MAHMCVLIAFLLTSSMVSQSAAGKPNLRAMGDVSGAARYIAFIDGTEPSPYSVDYLNLLQRCEDSPHGYCTQDAGYAIEKANDMHEFGIEKGHFLAELYVKVKVTMDESLRIANKVHGLCDDKIAGIQEREEPLKAKIAGAKAADKVKGKLTGNSRLDVWKDDLESDYAEAKFYQEIIRNAEIVKKQAKKGLSDVAEFRLVVTPAKELGQDMYLKKDFLVGTATKVYKDALALWKQWIDSSKDYDCGIPPSVNHAASICKNGNTKFSPKCNVQCETGYDGNGTKNNLRCEKQGKFGKQLYGEWTGMATCVGRNCGKPPSIKFAQVVVQDIRYPHSAQYHCYEGFSVDGGASSPKAFDIPCGATGSFERNSSHACIAITCGNAPQLPHTEPVPGTFHYTDVVTYKCLRGYTVDETAGGLTNFSVSCQGNGKFTSTQQCKPVRCGPPPDFTHTIVTTKKTDKFFGDKVKFGCKPGYSLNQDPNGPSNFTLLCDASGEFEVLGGVGVVKPKCMPVSAGLSPKVTYSDCPPKEHWYGQTVTCTADTGYSTMEKPDDGLTFLMNVTTKGTYAGIQTFLPVSCGAPPVVQNSKQKFSLQKAVYGDVLDYECKFGYSVDKTDLPSSLKFSITCESDADFSRIPGVGKCVDIDDCIGHTCGPRGECVDEIGNYSCKCDSGFKQTVDAESGEKVCGNINDCGPDACGAGKCVDEVNDFRCVCPTGYENIGQGKDKTCAKVVCGVPPKVAHALATPVELQTNKAAYQDKVVYQCAAGYTTSGVFKGKNHFSIECQASRKFTAVEECKPVKCGNVPSVARAKANATSAVFLEIIKYTCDDGFSIDGSAAGDGHFYTSCASNGQLSTPMTCKPISCGEPDEVANAFRESGQVYFPQDRKYECFAGFTLDGNAGGSTEFDVTCQKDGKLSDPKECTAVSCGKPDKYINVLYATTADEGVVRYPRVTDITCLDGYTVGGDPNGNKTFGIQCQKDGKFARYDKGSCDPVRCGAPPTFPNAALKSSTATNLTNLNFEEKAEYECLPGFTAGGQKDAPTTFIVECLANGQTSAPPADMQCRDVNACEDHTCGPKGTCIDTVGVSVSAYGCNCSFGFHQTIVKGEKYCGNIDDCGHDKCGAGTCKDLVGGYTCECPSGYYIGVKNGEKTCAPVRCASSTPTLQHGTLLTSHTGPVDFPKTLRYKCADGYSTDGTVAAAKQKFQAKCGVDGALYGMQSCQKISCGSPWVLAFTHLSSHNPVSSIVFEEKAIYNCVNGYTVGGVTGGRADFDVQCQATGQLTSPSVCEPVKCGRPPHVSKSRPAIAGDVFYGMHLDYLCDLGYTLDGTATGAAKFQRSCQANGKFSNLSTAQPCKPISAGQCPTITNAKLTEFNGVTHDPQNDYPTAYYPDSVEYHCLPGYTLTGTPTGLAKFVARVSAQGNFVPALPTKCVKITYTLRGIVKNARNGQGLTGAKVTVVGTSIKDISDNGYFTLNDVPPGNYIVKYEMNDYITSSRNITVVGIINVGGVLDLSMSPEMAPDEWRAVVKWKEEPTDLDTHAKWGHSHVWWQGKNARSSNIRGTLEHDDVDSFGPETLHLKGVGKCRGGSSMCDIKYQIHDYTEKGKMLDVSGAQVTLYHGHGIEGSWTIEQCKNVPAPGYWWDVFIIDGKTNKLKWDCTQPPAPPVTPGLLEQVYYFDQKLSLPPLNGRAPDNEEVVYAVDYLFTGLWNVLTRQTNFAARWEGSLKVRGAGTYTFSLASGDGSKLWLDEDLVVNNNGMHDMRQGSGRKQLSAGLHALRIDYFKSGSYNAGIVFKWNGPDSSSQDEVVPQSALRQNPVLPGLLEEVFYGQVSGSTVPSLIDSSPNMARQVDTVNYASTSQKWNSFTKSDDFAVRWTGFVQISSPGSYKFSLTSDEGSKLWLTRQVLVDNDGLHGMRTKSGSKTLATGFFRIKMQMFERSGGAGMIFKYKGPDTNGRKVVVPKTALFKTAGTPPVVDINAGITEEVFYFSQGKDKLMDLFGRQADNTRNVDFVHYEKTSNKWPGFTQKDNFAVRWTGSLVIVGPGSYELSTTSDDGSSLWLGNDLVVNNDGLHGMKTKSGSVYLSAGNQAIRIDYFEKGGGAGCKFNYKGPDSNNRNVVVPRRALRKFTYKAGLLEEAFYLMQSLNKLPNLVDEKPQAVQTVATLNYARTGSTWSGFHLDDDYAARWSGFVSIVEGGSYKFYIESDDGSKLWLDNQLLVDNDGSHSMREKSGTSSLSDVTQVKIKVEYFQATGGHGMILKYKGKDTSNQKIVVPANRLTRVAGSPAPSNNLNF